MTLAALLEQRGMTPTLIERAPSFEHAGYMLGLYPLGSRVLHGIGLYERFAAESLTSREYEAFTGAGHPIRRWDLGSSLERFGPLLSCTRPQLVEVLRRGCGELPIRFGVAVEDVAQRDGEVVVSLSDGSEERADLLVGADGIHSKVRAVVFGEQPFFDTGWGGWVWWADSETMPPERVAEYWGAGRFLGAYPTQRGVGIFAGAPIDDGFDQPGAGRRTRLRERFSGMGPLVDTFLEAVPDDDAEMFFWRLSDVRAAEWVREHVVLLGDAAVGFLPTAGIGASMAMESAAVLADELSRTDLRFLEHALALYVKRRRKRVEAIQDASRKLAKLMFVKSRPMAAVRNLTSRFLSVEMVMRDILRAFDEPI